MWWDPEGGWQCLSWEGKHLATELGWRWFVAQGRLRPATSFSVGIVFGRNPQCYSKFWRLIHKGGLHYLILGRKAPSSSVGSADLQGAYGNSWPRTTFSLGIFLCGSHPRHILEVVSRFWSGLLKEDQITFPWEGLVEQIIRCPGELTARNTLFSWKLLCWSNPCMCSVLELSFTFHCWFHERGWQHFSLGRNAHSASGGDSEERLPRGGKSQQQLLCRISPWMYSGCVGAWLQFSEQIF